MQASPAHWWQQADQFDWFSAYLRDRGLQRRWRATTGTFTTILGVVPVVLIASPTGPDHPATIVVSVVAALAAAASGALWLRRWPTRRQSTTYVLVVTALIAATCLSQSDPYAALMGCTTFAILGGFVAYFHTVVLVTVSLGTALICATIATGRLVHSTGDIALAVSALLIVVALNVGVPFGINSLAHILRSDLRSAGFDPLTGLLNRAAFRHSAHELLMRDDPENHHLVVALIDLDAFKHLNDTQGHASGDQALVRVGSVLRETCGDTAVIGRIGGEEFVIADRGAVADPAALAEQLRAAIAALPFPVTASIGTTSTSLPDDAIHVDPQLIDRLVRTADSAMYNAKRAGGNQVWHEPQLTDR
jgi:diguanylate cyclase (GGDEF)-like protein